MDLTEYVREFRRLQKTQKIRVSDYCREMMLDYYEMVEALKKDKFLSELPDERVESSDLELTEMPLTGPDPSSLNFIKSPSRPLPTSILGYKASPRWT